MSLAPERIVPAVVPASRIATASASETNSGAHRRRDAEAPIACAVVGSFGVVQQYCCAPAGSCFVAPDDVVNHGPCTPGETVFVCAGLSAQVLAERVPRLAGIRTVDALPQFQGRDLSSKGARTGFKSETSWRSGSSQCQIRVARSHLSFSDHAR
jgi:hypothetical protein